MITRAIKKDMITAISDRFGKAKAAFLIDFKGLDVERMTILRKKLGKMDTEVKVVRNTLARVALKDHPAINEALGSHFVGNNAVVFAYGDAAATAKTLSDFVNDFEELQMKSGVLDGRLISESGIKFLATLPAKPVLQAQLLGVFNAPGSKFVRTLNEVPSQFVRLLNAYKESKASAG